MAYESISQYPKGSAEYTATYLTTRGLGCSHPVKYHADGTQEHSKYPSRLGFFHVTSQEPRISFLDTRKLCNACLDAVVPDGFHFWSAYSIINGTSASEARVPEPRWLDMASSSDNYPPLVQSGTEGFPHVPLLSGLIPPHLILPPVVLSIPKVTGAKATWEWLQTRKKPFYIDQLHLTKGWSLIVERRAKIDSMIAERSGTAYCPEAEPKTKDRKQNSSGKAKTSSEEEIGSATTTALRTKDKKKPAKDRHSPPLVTIESTGSIDEPNVALDEIDNLSKLVKVHKRKDHSSKEHISPPLHISPEDSKDTTTMKSAEQPPKKTSSTSKTGKGAKEKKDQITSVSNLGLEDNTLSMIAPVQCVNLEPITTSKPKLAETAIGMAPPRKTIQFTFTKNWSNHDPIPYDGPNVHLQFSDYRRQAQVTDHAGDPGSKFSPEKLMGKKQPTKGKISLSDPNSSDGTPDMTTLPRAAEAGELKIPMKVSSTTETKTTKIKPTTGDSSKKIKPSTEGFVGNEPVGVKPRKEAGSSGERIGESGPRQEEPTKPSKTRIPEHGRAVDKLIKNEPLPGLRSEPKPATVGKPIKNKPLPDLRSEPKPASVTYPSTKFGDSKLKRPVEKSSSGKKFSISFDADFGFDLHLGKSSGKDSKKKPDNHGASGAASFVQSDPLPNSSTSLPPTEESMTGPPEEGSTSLSSIQKPPPPPQGEMPSETGISSPHVEDTGSENTLHNPNVEASTTTRLDQPLPQVEGSSGSEFTENPTYSLASIIIPLELPPSQVETSPRDAEITNVGHAQKPEAAFPTPVTGEPQGVIPSLGDAQSTNTGHAYSLYAAATMLSVRESQKVDAFPRGAEIINAEHTHKPEAAVLTPVIGESQGVIPSLGNAQSTNIGHDYNLNAAATMSSIRESQKVDASPRNTQIINAGHTQGLGTAVPTPVTGQTQGIIPFPRDAQSSNIGHAHGPNAAATILSVREPQKTDASTRGAEIMDAGHTQGPKAAVPTPVTGQPQGVIPSPGDAQSTNIRHSHGPDAAATMSSIGESQKVDDSPGDTQIAVGHTQNPEAGVTTSSIGKLLQAVAKAQEKPSKPKPTTFKSPEERHGRAVPYHTEYPKEATARYAAQPRRSMNIPPEKEPQQSGHLQSINIVNLPSGGWGDDGGSGGLGYGGGSSAGLYGTNDNSEIEDDSNDNNSNGGNEDGDSDQEDGDGEESEGEVSESENDGNSDGDGENEDADSEESEKEVSESEKEDGESEQEDDSNSEKEDSENEEEDSENGEGDSESEKEDDSNSEKEDSGSEKGDSESEKEDSENEKEDSESEKEESESEKDDNESEREDNSHSEEEENNYDDESDFRGSDDEDD